MAGLFDTLTLGTLAPPLPETTALPVPVDVERARPLLVEGLHVSATQLLI